jgi:FHS family L-fucose permease-like MFS transporter
VAILGPEHSAPQRLTLAQAFNSIGCTIAPIFAGAYILTDPASLTTQSAVANTVKVPYILIAGALLLLGLALAFMRLPHISTTQEFRPGKEGNPILGRSIFSYKHTVLGAMGIFFYVGVEVGLASIAVNYFLTQGIDSEKVASFFTSLGSFGALITSWFGPWTAIKIAALLLALYWFGALVGRLLGSWMLTKIQAGKLLGIFGGLATAMILVSMFTNGSVAIYSLVLCGFFNSIMFPNIFALGIAGLGPMTSKGSGLIMTCVVGGAIVPPLIGFAADKLGSIQMAFFIPAICYAFIAFYGFIGHKPSRTVTA